MPPWLDPALVAPPTFTLWVILAYFLVIVGGEWVNDSLCTLGLALKVEPLFVGLIVTTLVGIVPMLALAAVFSATAHPQLVLGTLVGASWGTTLLPLALAGLLIPVGTGERWPRVDLPLFVTYFVAFIFFCLEPAWNPLKAPVIAGVAVLYLAFRYMHGKEARYGLAAFGRNFIFGASILSTLFKFFAGLSILASGCYLLYIFATGALVRWSLPALPVGFALALPLCITEIAFALSAVKKGQGELIMGRSMGLGTLIVLLGGAVMSGWKVEHDVNDINFIFMMFVVGLLALWLFVRSSHRLWKWQAGVLLIFTLACTVVLWLQGYGHLAKLRLPPTLGF